MIKGVAKVAVLEFVCFYIFNLSIIFLNFILIVFFLNYLGDSAAADRAFATRFFLSNLVFVFQFKHKTKRRQRSNNCSSTIANPHNTINYITINNSISYREPYHFRYNRRNNLGTIFNLLLVKFIKNTPIRLKWRKTMRPKRLYLFFK